MPHCSSIKYANAWITQWYLALQPFKFKVVQRLGVQMAVADFLSRLWRGLGSAGWLHWAVSESGRGSA